MLKQRKNQRGQALVEMTIILPVLLILFAVLIEAGFIFYNHFELEAAGREVARWAAADREQEYWGGGEIGEGSTTFELARRFPVIDAMAVTYVRIGREDGKAVLVEVTRNKVGPIEWEEVPEIDVDALVAGHQVILELNPRATDMVAVFVDTWHDHPLFMDILELADLRTYVRCMFRVAYQRKKGVP